MRCVGRHRLQRLRHDFGDLLVTDLARRAAARLVIKAIEALFGKPFRHSPTVSRETPSVAAIAQLLMPSPANSTILARTASTRAIFRRRAHISNSLRSLSPTAGRHLHLRIKKTGKGNHDPTVMTRNF